jgi:hypothetical protein
LSQIYKSLVSGPVPPTVATSYVTDDGVAVPIANILDVFGGTLTLTNDNGIQTNAGPAGNQLNVNLTNRTQNRIVTTDATNQTLDSFSLSASDASYCFDIEIACYNVTDDLAASYSIFGGVRSTSSVAFLIGVPDKIVNEEAGMLTCDANLVVSGNNAIIQVNGIAGKTINWNCVITYVTQTKV